MKQLRFLLIILIPLLLSEKNTSELVVIVNSDNTTKPLTPSEVKLIYLRKITRRWSGINKNIVPVDRKDSPEIKELFLNTILGMSDDELDRYYTERGYQNEELPPVTLASDAEVIGFVSKNIGAIGYVSSSSLNKDNSVKIKIVYP